MNRTVAVPTIAIALIAGGAGAIVGVPWAVAGAISGAVVGYLTGRAGMRPFVAIAVAAGTLGGALVGRGVVRALCLPGSCTELEVVGAIFTGVGALIGVGLVVALVTRSFDEYHDAVAANRPPPTPGCEADESVT
jgi:MFS family permease